MLIHTDTFSYYSAEDETQYGNYDIVDYVFLPLWQLQTWPYL